MLLHLVPGINVTKRIPVVDSLPASLPFCASRLSSVPDWKGAFLGYSQQSCDGLESEALVKEDPPVFT